MCENSGKGPNIDFNQVDIPKPHKYVIGWNKKKHGYKCSICTKRKTFPLGPVVLDADNKLNFVCSKCAKGRVVPGLVALLSLGEMAMTDDMSAIFSALEGVNSYLKKYREAVEPREQP